MEMANLPHQPQHIVGACSLLCCQFTAVEQSVSMLSSPWQEAAFHVNHKVLDIAITTQGFHQQSLSCFPKAGHCSRLANKSDLKAMYLMLNYSFLSPFPTSTNFLQNPDGDLTAVLLFQACLRISIIKIKQEGNENTSSWQGMCSGGKSVNAEIKFKADTCMISLDNMICKMILYFRLRL